MHGHDLTGDEICVLHVLQNRIGLERAIGTLSSERIFKAGWIFTRLFTKFFRTSSRINFFLLVLLQRKQDMGRKA